MIPWRVVGEARIFQVKRNFDSLLSNLQDCPEQTNALEVSHTGQQEVRTLPASQTFFIEIHLIMIMAAKIKER